MPDTGRSRHAQVRRRCQEGATRRIESRTGAATAPSGSPLLAPPQDLVDRPLVERDDEQGPVGRGLDVGDDPEVDADDVGSVRPRVVEGRIVRDPVARDSTAVAGELEGHETPTERVVVDRESDEEIAEPLRAEGPRVQKADRG